MRYLVIVNWHATAMTSIEVETYKTASELKAEIKGDNQYLTATVIELDRDPNFAGDAY